MPNPLRDELTDEAKAELAAIFADMRRRWMPSAAPRQLRRPMWERRGW